MKKIFFSFFLESIKLGFWIGIWTVVRALFLLTLSTDIDQVVRQSYQLGNIVKATELAIFKALSSSVLLRLNSCFPISNRIGLFDFNIRKGQAIDKDDNIWTKFVLTILTGHFQCQMEGVCFWVFPINIYGIFLTLQLFKERTSQIILI